MWNFHLGGQTMSRILISYRREDSTDITGRIYDRLVQQFGREAIFKDVDSIPLGVDFRIHLDEQVSKCQVFLAVIGRAWKGKGGSRGSSRLRDTQDFVRIEIESALRRGIPVIPVLVGGASIPPVEQLPDGMQDLSYRHGIAVRPDPDFHRDMDRLIEQLKIQIKAIEEQHRAPRAASSDTNKDLMASGQNAHSGLDQFQQDSFLESRALQGPIFQGPLVQQPREETSSQANPASEIKSHLDSTSTAKLESKLLEQISSTTTIVPAAKKNSGANQQPQTDAQTPTCEGDNRSDGAPGTVGAKKSRPYIFVGAGLLVAGTFVAYGILLLSPFFPEWTVSPSTATFEAGRPQSQVGAPSSQLKLHAEMGIQKDGPPMVLISLGQFKMGSLKNPDEAPVREVRFFKPFAIAKYETTFEEYDHFAQATHKKRPRDPGFGRGRRPVLNVLWQDARDYATWLSQETGKRYRLPTEAEWEYAARSIAKHQDDIWSGTSEEIRLPNYAVFQADRTEPVGSKESNGLGLYDMSGNAWEWVEDCWHENYQGAPTDGSAWLKTGGGNCSQRVIRGGSYYDKTPEVLRTLSRFWSYTDDRYGGLDIIGFRLAQDLD